MQCFQLVAPCQPLLQSFNVPAALCYLFTIVEVTRHATHQHESAVHNGAIRLRANTIVSYCHVRVGRYHLS